MAMGSKGEKRRLVAALACRNQGSRLFGKPLQNLDVVDNMTVIKHLVSCLRSVACIDEVVLGISEGGENDIYRETASSLGIRFIIGDQIDVLSRLCQCGDLTSATDIFRVTSESPFPYFEAIDDAWNEHIRQKNDATFFDEIIDGCGFEIIALDALKKSHTRGDARHRSELCTLFLREHKQDFKLQFISPCNELIRRDLRLTIDYPEDLVVCRKIYEAFKEQAPRIPVKEIVKYLDNNPTLKQLIYPYAEEGYNTMYVK